MNSRNDVMVIMCVLFIGAFCFFTSSAAQSQEREYVIGVGDQLDVQVFNQVQILSNFSARVEVRSDRMITMPWLGDIKVAGLKKSTLTTLLESQEYLGKFLTEPHVTITPTRMSASITVLLSGVVNGEEQLPRDTKFGQFFANIAPSLQQYDPNVEAISINSIEGEVFAADQNIRLQWGDEIVIPASAPTPTPIPPEAVPLPSDGVQLSAQFTDEEYQAFQAFMGDYLEAYELLLPLVRREGDATFIDLTNLTNEQQAQLPQAVLDELRRYLPEAEQLLQTGIRLLGIRINLLQAEGLLEAFLEFPQPEGGTLIRRFREGDALQSDEDGAEEIILRYIDETAQHVIVEQGDSQQTLPLAPPLGDISLLGIVTNGHGNHEAILQGAALTETQEIPTQRKRYAEGDSVAPGITLVKIVNDQQVAILQDEKQAVQILFLRDSRKRAASQPQGDLVPTSPFAVPDPFATPPSVLPEGITDGLLKQQAPAQL